MLEKEYFKHLLLWELAGKNLNSNICLFLGLSSDGSVLVSLWSVLGYLNYDNFSRLQEINASKTLSKHGWFSFVFVK